MWIKLFEITFGQLQLKPETIFFNLNMMSHVLYNVGDLSNINIAQSLEITLRSFKNTTQATFV